MNKLLGVGDCEFFESLHTSTIGMKGLTKTPMSVVSNERVSCYVDASASKRFTFQLGSKSFGRQFAKLYEIRLGEMMEVLKPKVHRLWG